MYVSEFWVGVVAGAFLGFCLLFALAILGSVVKAMKARKEQ